MRARWILFLLALVTFPLQSQAGRNCESVAPTTADLVRATHAAMALRDRLEGEQATLVLLGRVGADLSAYGLRYTHAGIAMRDHPDGRWLVRHLLNVCGTDRSSLHDQGLISWFLDDLYALDTLVVVPTAPVQHQLQRIALTDIAVNLHQPRYSMIAHPFSTRYQNSNQWLLELIAVSLSPNAPGSREEAQAYLRRTGYRPDRIEVPFLKRFGARLFSANIRFDDHDRIDPGERRLQVASVRSLVSYMRRKSLADRQFVVRAPVPR